MSRRHESAWKRKEQPRRNPNQPGPLRAGVALVRRMLTCNTSERVRPLTQNTRIAACVDAVLSSALASAAAAATAELCAALERQPPALQLRVPLLPIDAGSLGGSLGDSGGSGSGSGLDGAAGETEACVRWVVGPGSVTGRHGAPSRGSHFSFCREPAPRALKRHE